MARVRLLQWVLSIMLVFSGVSCGRAPAAPASTPLASTPPSPAAAHAPPIASTATAATAATGDARHPTGTPPTSTPGRLDQKVDVGGYRLQIRCLGEGSSTVVFEAGLATPGWTWVASPGRRSVWQEVAKTTRACIYDRAGLGDSDADPGPRPRTSQRIVDDLHTLLTNAGIHGPYVLVSWSFGGLNVRLFTQQHRADVAGLVLLDSSHEEQRARYAALKSLLPAETPNECQSLKQMRSEPPVEDWRLNPEGVDFAASARQVAATGFLGDLPLAVLTAGKIPPTSACVPRAYIERAQHLWLELQDQLARLSTNSMHLVAEQSGHCIHCDQPELVIDAIHKVIEAVRTGARLAAPNGLMRKHL